MSDFRVQAFPNPFLPENRKRRLNPIQWSLRDLLIGMDSRSRFRQHDFVRSGVSFGNDTGASENGLAFGNSDLGRLFFFVLFAFLPLLFLPRPAQAGVPVSTLLAANSVSGQFVVVGSPRTSPLAMLPEIATNQEFVKLDPALLAVSAERVKDSILRRMGINSDAMTGGTIYLTLKPAQALDEDVAVFPERFAGHWIYHVVLPDVLPRERLARALTSVFLLDYANRNGGPRCRQLPAWLTEGLSEEMLAENLEDIILSVPDASVNDIPVDRVSFTERGVDPLANARKILQTYSILTFQQLCWPSDLQLSGEDGGVYRASAQLFVDTLLNLRNGPAKLRAMLNAVPYFYNWQTAFFSAYRGDFASPLDVEKWWALQTVVFAAQSPGPQWTGDVSRERLDEILSVAVDFRSVSNSLPTRAEVSLQEVIRNFNSTLQTEILDLKIRDLEAAQLRMAPSFAVLAAEYRNAIAGYLGEAQVTRRAVIVRKFASQSVSARETLRRLDALDARRRAIALANTRGLAD